MLNGDALYIAQAQTVFESIKFYFTAIVTNHALNLFNLTLFLAASAAEQIWLSVLVFSLFLLLSNLYQSCKNRVSFGHFDFQGTSPYGELYPSGPFVALCP